MEGETAGQDFELMGALLDACGRFSGSTQEEAREGFLEVARPEQPKGKQSKTWGECGGVAAESWAATTGARRWGTLTQERPWILSVFRGKKQDETGYNSAPSTGNPLTHKDRARSKVKAEKDKAAR